MFDALLQPIAQQLSHVEKREVRIINYSKLSGGSINAVFKLVTDTNKRFCCKVNRAAEFPGMFLNEAAGLKHLENSKAIRIPGVIVCFVTGDYQVLVLEWIEPGVKSEVFWKSFGKKLSQLHTNRSDMYGLDHDNYMGALKQSNRQHSNWTQFFINERILPQVKLAVDKKLLSPSQARQFDHLTSVLDSIFPDAAPCLLHGDLWSGNFLCDEYEQPVLIDPAVYHGHPAVDLGLTTLFGGFDKAFYDSYHYYNPLPANHQQQWECCNLYPLLIHLNLFGRSYLGDILSIIQKY